MEPSYAPGDGWWLTPPDFPPPDQFLDASPGWEVATRLYSTKPVCVTGFRFWRAAGETGTNRVRLWTNSGQLIASTSVNPSPTSGWVSGYFSSVLCLQPYTYYRVSVNTNTRQAKRGGVFLNGPIVNGPMVSTSGYYGQPTGSMPNTASASYFYVEVYVVES